MPGLKHFFFIIYFCYYYLPFLRFLAISQSTYLIMIFVVARNRAERGGKLTERWSSLAYIIRKKMYETRSRVLTKWHEPESQDREASRRGLLCPTDKKKGISFGTWECF